MKHFLAGPSEPIASLPHHARTLSDWQCALVLHVVSRAYDISPYLILHPKRCMATTALARQLSMYLAHVLLGRQFKEVGRVFGRDRTTVSYACAKVEDMRDDPRFEDELADLERQITDLLELQEGDGHGAL
jgi:ATPase involved in DNA replication initiation